MEAGDAQGLQVETIRDEIRSVRDQIVEHTMRMEDIRLQQIPRIRADYALKIGCWEQALLEAELAARRARRRLALAQAEVNRGVTPQMDAIERVIEAELAEWTAKAEQARIAYEAALEHLLGTRPMTHAESKELKRLYRALVKRLHPDVCHADASKYASLFQTAQAAYKSGDIDTLRSLEVATRHLDHGTDDLESNSNLADLMQELELVRIEEGVVRERVQALEQGEEMRLGTLLADPAWVTARTTELRRAVEDWDRMRSECERRLEAMREGMHENQDL